MTDDMKTDDRKPLTGKKVALIIGAFFATFITVDMIFLTLATRTHTGVVTDNAYEKGLAYNDVVKKAEANENLGWSGDIAYVGGELRVTLTDKSGAPISGAVMKAEITRPLSGDYDLVIDLDPMQDGLYIKKLNFPMQGQWQIRIYSSWQNKHYQTSKRLVIK